MTKALPNRKILLWIFSFILLFSLVFTGQMISEKVVKATGTTYYVSSSTGNDNNSGTSSNSPWRTLTKVSNSTFSAGDVVQLKCGDTWSGEALYLHTSGGSLNNWTTLQSYGDTSQGKPKVYPGANSYYGIAILNDDNSTNYAWKVLGIEVGYAKTGIVSMGNKYGFWVENCFIHDITGLGDNQDQTMRWSCGIRVRGGDPQNVIVKNNHTDYCDVGISVWEAHNALIQGCLVTNSGHLGIESISLVGGTITNCTVNNTGLQGNPYGTCGIENDGGQDVTISDCEISNTQSPSSPDGCALDFEGSCVNYTVNNCYMHNNSGRAVLIMPVASNQNINLTNNICVDNGWDTDQQIEPAFIWVWDNYAGGGTITGNYIKRLTPTQKINKIAWDLTDNYEYSFNAYNNTITDNPPTWNPNSPPPTVSPTVTATPTPTATPVPGSHTWDFNTNGNAQGWNAANDMGTQSVSGGYFGASITGADPYMLSSSGLGINISTNKIIKIRMKNSTGSTNGTIYFATNSDNSFNEAKKKDFTIVANDSGYTEYTIDMSSVSGWTGTLSQLRLDPANGATGSTSIDYIDIGTGSSPTDTATPTPTLTNTPTPTPTPTITATPVPGTHTWDFNTDGNFQGWNGAHDISYQSVSGGYMNDTITGDDPYIMSGSNLSINITNNKIIRVRMKNSTSSTEGAFYFTTNSDGAFNEAKKKGFTINANDSNYTEYTIDMSSISGWTGTLAQLRFDPTNGGTGSVSIDYIDLGTSSSSTATPTPTPTATPTPTPTATPGAGMAWEFNTNGNYEGWWMANNISYDSVSGGYLNGSIYATDPYMYSGDNISISSSNKIIRIRMKNSTNSTSAQLYFTTNTDNSFNDTKMKQFTITANDSGYTVYTLDMSSVSGWTGTIRRLRLDPNNDVTSGSFSIDYIRMSAT